MFNLYPVSHLIRLVIVIVPKSLRTITYDDNIYTIEIPEFNHANSLVIQFSNKTAIV